MDHPLFPTIITSLILMLIAAISFVAAMAWRKELAILCGRMWLYSVILKDVCLGKSPRSDLRDTREYRAYRSMKAALELDDFLSSAELALFSACNLKSRQKYHIPLWELREHYYFIDLALREVKCQSGNSITATTIRVVLEEFRDVYPDYDPYMCFRLRITDAMNMVEDFNKMED